MATDPVVLVHGYLASPTLMRPLQWRLRRAGRTAHTVSLTPLAIGDVRRMAEQLDRSVARVLADTGADRVDLVGISLGGILGRYWLQELGGAAKTRRFVAVGSPFAGTWFAALGVLTLGLVSRGAWQCLPGSGLLRQIEGEVPVPCTSISMQGDRVAPPHRCRVEGATNVVLQPPRYASAVAHQYLVLSGRTTQEIVSALSRP